MNVRVLHCVLCFFMICLVGDGWWSLMLINDAIVVMVWLVTFPRDQCWSTIVFDGQWYFGIITVTTLRFMCSQTWNMKLLRPQVANIFRWPSLTYLHYSKVQLNLWHLFRILHKQCDLAAQNWQDSPVPPRYDHHQHLLWTSQGGHLPCPWCWLWTKLP